MPNISEGVKKEFVEFNNKAVIGKLEAQKQKLGIVNLIHYYIFSI